MAILKAANLAIGFLLELAMLAAFVVWGLSLDAALGFRVAVAVLAPVLVAAFWGARLAPQARRRLVMPWILLAKVIIYALASVALVAAGRPAPGVALLAVALFSLGVGWALRQEAIVTRRPV